MGLSDPLEVLGWIVLALLVVGVALVLHVRFWERRYALPMIYESEERLATPDGAAVELRRLPRRGNSAAPPVLLVHGLGANHRNHDLAPDISLARTLAEAGRDVWLLTLRSGLSAAGRRRHIVRFDRMAEHDLSVGVARVLELTGAARLDYVGFSMGGMLLYAALGATLSPGNIRRVAIIGSPATLRAPSRLLFAGLVAKLPSRWAPTVRLRLLAGLTGFAAEWVATPLHRVILNPENVAPGVARLSMFNLVADVPGPLNLDFASFAAAPRGEIHIKGTSVLEGLELIDLPVLFIAGAGDRLAPPASVRAAYEAWGRSAPHVEKRFILLGREQGASADYGHGDLAIGAEAAREVFAPVRAFLAEPTDDGR